jgi:hypothetical protein
MRRRLLHLVAIVPLVAACCQLDCGPYTTGELSVPFSVMLSANDPVAIRDLGMKDVDLPPNTNATATLNLRNVDSRFRVATIGTIDSGLQGVERIGRFRHPDYKSDIAADIGRQPCYSDDCKRPVRLIFELTDLRTDDVLKVDGSIDIRYGYPGKDKLPEKVVEITGLDDAIPGHAPATLTASDAGPVIRLDADHPIALQPITIGLDADAAAEEGTVVSESVVHSVDGIAYLVEPENPTFQYNGIVQQILGTPEFAMDPYATCDLGRDTSCATDGVLRLTWVGPDPVDTAYSIDTVVAGYGESGLPSGIRAATTYGDPLVVPDNAPRIARAHDGMLKLDRGSADGRATAWFRLQLDNAPPAPQSSIVEVPGIVVLTYAATGRGDAAGGGGKPARLRVNGSLQPSPPLIDVPLDGKTRTVGLPLFASCRPGQSCTSDFFFELFPAFEGEDTLPVTLTYTLEARLSSFDTRPFPGDTSLSIGPKP